MVSGLSVERQPFLRWAGSKRQLVPTLRELAPREFERYVEPFAGSACLFFALRPAHALLSDFNAALIQSYRVVRDHPKLLARQLRKYPSSENCYYKLRSLDPQSLDSITEAARFIFLNAHCFNGVYRTNSAGKFNVPFGSKTGGAPTLHSLLCCSIALRSAKITCQKYEDTLDECYEGDFVYMDPPYTTPGTRYRGEYGIGSFSASNEDELLSRLAELDDIGVKFLLSYRATHSFIRKLNPQWYIRRIQVRRSVSGFAKTRRKAIEILVRNYEIDGIDG